MGSQEISYCYAGNLAKGIQCVSTAGGIVLGIIATEEYFNKEYGTVAQITSLSIPLLMLLGTLYRRSCNLSPKNGPSIPIPFTAGLAIGVIAETAKMDSSPCSIMINCENDKQGLWRQCSSIFDICKKMVQSMDAWESVYDKNAIANFCDPTNAVDTTYDNVNKVANLICSRIFDLDPFQNWHVCENALNLDQESINKIGQMQVTLFNTSDCNPGTIYTGIKNADVILFIGVSVIFVLGALYLHPLVIDPKIRPFYINLINPATDPLLSELPQEPSKSKVEIMLDNI